MHAPFHPRWTHRLPRVGLFCLVLFALPACGSAQWVTSDDTARSGTIVRQAFAESAAPVVRATVSVLVDDKQAALGVLVSSDGHILTKASELRGPIRIRTSDGKLMPAEIVGVAMEHDLAMIRLDASGLARPAAFVPVRFTEGPDVSVGRMVASVGTVRSPLAVGVIGVERRMIPADVIMGVILQDHLEGGARVMEVSRNGGAWRAGLRANDVIVEIDGSAVTDRGDVTVALSRKAPGQAIQVRVRRDDQETDYQVTLSLRPAPSARAARQNRMGGRLSERRGGFAAVLQHDMVTLDPSQCGSAVIDLDGNVVGLNIARAGRTETYAIPSAVVAGLIPELLSGKYPPTTNPAEGLPPPVEAADAPSAPADAHPASATRPDAAP